MSVTDENKTKKSSGKSTAKTTKNTANDMPLPKDIVSVENKLPSVSKNETYRLMESNAPYPSIDEVESDSTRSLDAARTHVLEQMNIVSRSEIKHQNPLATMVAIAKGAQSIAELVKAKVEIYEVYSKNDHRRKN